MPRNRGTVLTVIGALTIDGLTAMMTIEGATTGDVFLAYVEEVLGPELRPGDIVVVDNLGAHRDHRVKEAVERRGARLFFQPPYSPDKNPIELAWAWVKWSLRTAEARTREALETALRWAMDMLDSTIARLWFRHCGFRNQLL
ncbi:MAG: IS630 family transposase [Myxococcota bacterium]